MTRVRKINTKLVVSATEVRGFSKAVEQSNGEPVCVMSHNKPIGYIVPVEAVQPIRYVSDADFDEALETIVSEDKEILERLKDR